MNASTLFRKTLLKHDSGQALLNRDSGQALLIVIVTLAAVITVALSVVARSVTDLRNVGKEEESLRSFSAAEAGIEKALITANLGQTVTITDGGTLENATFVAQVSDFAQGASQFSHPKEMLSGESATVWFIAHDQNGDLTCGIPTQPCFTGNRMRICWGLSGTNGSVATTPAMEVSVTYDPDANGNWDDIQIARAAYDPNSGRRGSNFFASPDSGTCTIGNKTYQFQKNIQFNSDLGINNTGGLLVARIRMLYNTTTAQPIGIDVNGSGSLLPGQGKRVESVGRSGESSRKVEAYTLFPDLPSIFDSAIFSPIGITK